MKKYLVETISQHLVRYVVEARNESHALDEVFINTTSDYNENWSEFSQRHIGENVISSREITEDEYINLFDKDNSYLKSWTNERKLSFINKIEYDDKEAIPDEREWEYDGLGNKVYKGTMQSYVK